MTDDLLKYYNSELAFLRQMGAEFASETVVDRFEPQLSGADA